MTSSPRLGLATKAYRPPGAKAIGPKPASERSRVETLRARVREAARHVCRHLAEAYPFQRLSTSPSCYRETVENGLLRADEAINAAQDDYLYGYE